jgi:2-phosphosulfolactate phosphatase
MAPSMRILRKSLLAGAGQAEGLVVIIDVMRAFTSAAFMMHLGAHRIILLAEPEAVLQLKRDRGFLAVGEVGGKTVPGFDLGNSPSRILAAGRDLFSGRVVALRTSAGVTGAVAAGRHARSGGHSANGLILGSYVTARATARYIHQLSPAPEAISLVAMGDAGTQVTPDDEACADYLEHLLTGRAYDHVTALRRIVEHECTQKFLRADQAHFPPSDPVYCLQRDLFDFVLVAKLEDGQLAAQPVNVAKESTI